MHYIVCTTCVFSILYMCYSLLCLLMDVCVCACDCHGASAGSVGLECLRGQPEISFPVNGHKNLPTERDLFTYEC